MDSLSQFALGAGIGLAVGGRRLGPRKAVLAGGLLGTLPDLDVFIPLGDPVNDFILHRGPSHSLIIQAIATPLIGETFMRFFKDLRYHRWLTYLLVYLALSTHALLDAMTVYGTRILWPLPPDPFGVGSLFIIDPLYTLPLLVAMIWALFLKDWLPPVKTVTALGLGLSTLYAGWSVLGQKIAGVRAESYLREHNIALDHLMITPTPFNTLFWRAIAISDNRYFNLYIPLLSDGVQFYAHDRGVDSVACLDGVGRAQDLITFANGFFKTQRIDERLVISDLRMGVTPAYVFNFAVAENDAGDWHSIEPVQIRTSREISDNDLAWLWAGITGKSVVRMAERRLSLDGMRLAVAQIGNQRC